MSSHRFHYADDDAVSIRQLAWMRLPSLGIGLLLGVGLSFATSSFEEVLRQNIHVAFFIPFIVYMADAVGTQTQNIYTRDLRTGHASFKTYLFKETILGLFLGAISSVIAGGITLAWFGDTTLAMAVFLAMGAAVASAPLVALVITELLELEKTDPAVGAGPIATVIQDTISVVIYGLITSALLLS